MQAIGLILLRELSTMSKNDYIKKCLVSFIVFSAGTMLNIVRPNSSNEEFSGIASILTWMAIPLLLYSIYLYSSSTMKVFQQNEIPKWYALTPVYIWVIASIVSILESTIPMTIVNETIEGNLFVVVGLSVVSYLLTTLFAFFSFAIKNNHI